MDTGLNLVDVAEVARAHVAALTLGQPGRRYILGGENLTLKQILDKMSAITGIPSPTVKIPFAVAAIYAFFEEWITGRIRGHEPRATRRRGPHGPQENVRLQRTRATGARLPHCARLPGHARRHRVVPRPRLCAKGSRMTRVAIIAAMPGELKPLVRGWQHQTRNGVHLWQWKFDEGEWIAACAGAGADAATRAFAETEKDGPIDLAISTGWAGSLRESLLRGEAYRIGGVIDVQTGERFSSSGWSNEPWVVTSPRVAGAMEKDRLASAYHAGLVDMEAAAIARIASMRNIPFYCVKGVSDGLSDHLPDFNRFITPLGQFQLGRFILWFLIADLVAFIETRYEVSSVPPGDVATVGKLLLIAMRLYEKPEVEETPHSRHRWLKSVHESDSLSLKERQCQRSFSVVLTNSSSMLPVPIRDRGF